MINIDSFSSTTSHYALSQKVKDFYEITKPKVVLMLVVTALVGMVLARPELPDVLLMTSACIGIGLLSASAAAFNHIVDKRIDAQMARTHSRPLAKGRLKHQQAFGFAIVLATLGFGLLYTQVNPLCAWLTLAGLLGYAVVYTLWLKRSTPQNIVIGGLAGALPPLLGWVAITGQIEANALILVMIVFTWTPPHFWALAIHRKEDYAKVNIPMLPVTHGVRFTKECIFLYSVLLTLVCLFPYLVGMSGKLYLIVSMVLNFIFIRYAWILKTKKSNELALPTFKYSIWYLLILFVALLVDHYLSK